MRQRPDTRAKVSFSLAVTKSWSRLISPLQNLGISAQRMPEDTVLYLSKDLRHTYLEPSINGVTVIYYDEWGPAGREHVHSLSQALAKAQSYVLKPPVGVF